MPGGDGVEDTSQDAPGGTDCAQNTQQPQTLPPGAAVGIISRGMTAGNGKVRIVGRGAVRKSTSNVRWSKGVPFPDPTSALSVCSAATIKWRANCDRHGTHARPCLQPKQRWHSHHVAYCATVLKARYRKIEQSIQRHAAGGNQLGRSCTLQVLWHCSNRCLLASCKSLQSW